MYTSEIRRQSDLVYQWVFSGEVFEHIFYVFAIRIYT